MPCHRSWGILWLMRKSVVMTFSFTANAGIPPKRQNDIGALWGVLVCLLTNTKKLPSLPLPRLWLPCKWNPDASPRGQPQHLPRCSVRLTEDPGPWGWADAGKKTRSCCPQLAQVSVRPGTETWWLCCWAWLANSKKKGNYNQNAFKRSRGFGWSPKHTVCSLHPPLCDASIWALQPLGHLWHVQQAAMQGRRCRCRSLLAKWKGRATSLLQALLLEVSVPTGSLTAWRNCALGWSNPPAPPPPGKPFSWRQRNSACRWVQCSVPPGRSCQLLQKYE